MSMKSRPTLWIAAALVMVFLAGATAGFFFDRLAFPRPERHMRRPPSSPFPSMEMLTRELGLTADQQARIRAIFARNEERFKELRGDIRRHLSEIRAQLKREMDKVLTAEQQSKLEKMIEQHRSRGGRRHDSPPPGRDRHPSERSQGERR
jgi:Spy/CpxP family protein refolding chaperone